MTLESLPNEIVIQCFQYLHYLEIFHAFERLNSRFDQLIGNIHFHLDFQHGKKSIFDQFCRRLLRDPSMKTQIFSLKLSNENDTCGQISAFFRHFSLEKFTRLHSLTLINLNQAEYDRIRTHLPSLCNLRSIVLQYPRKIDFPTFNSLPKVNKVALTLDEIRLSQFFIEKPLPITHLIAAMCISVNDLTKLLEFAPYLKSLDIRGILDESASWSNTVTVDLKRFALRTTEMSLNRIKLILKQMPKLEQLQLHCLFDVESIDGHRWEQLITSLLTHLTQFQFIFELSLQTPRDRSRIIDQICDKFQTFQTNFWQKQHRWYTAYQARQYAASIYTIPYLYDTFQLSMHTEQFSQDSFDHIRELTLIEEALQQNVSYYFCNVKTLRLIDGCHLLHTWEYFLDDLHGAHSLKKIVNLLNLNHLDMQLTSQSSTLLMLLKIFEESPRLSSLKVDADHMGAIVDRKLAQYFRKQIQKLHVTKTSTKQKITPEIIDSICRIFTNVEQLYFPINCWEDLYSLLTKLPKLSSVTVQYDDKYCRNDTLLQNLTTQLRRNFLSELIEYSCDSIDSLLHVWIGRRVH